MLTGALGFVDWRTHVQLGTVFWLLAGHRQERLAGSVVGQCRKPLRETKAIRTWAEALGRPSKELTAFSFPVLFLRGGTGLRWLDQGGPSRGRHMGLVFAWPQGGAAGHWAGPAPPGLCFPSSEGIPVLRGARRGKGGACRSPPQCLPLNNSADSAPPQMLLRAGKEGDSPAQDARFLLAVSFIMAPEGEI